MKIRLLFDNPHAYREWQAFLTPIPGFYHIVSRFRFRNQFGRYEEEKYELVIHEDQMEVVDP